jgi:hypothetical protein
MTNGTQLDASGTSGYDSKGQCPCAHRDTEKRISGGGSWVGRFTIAALFVAIVACQSGPADVGSTLPAGSGTDRGATTADSDASIADSAPISSPRPAASGYRQRYLSVVSPLIVHCMNDLGWEATYDPQHGALLADVPPSQVMERDRTMSFCVMGSNNYRGIFAY